MKRGLIFLFVLAFTTFVFGAFDDVVSEPENNVESTVESVTQTNVDVTKLAFKKEITGFAYKSSKATLPSVEKKIKTVMNAILPLIKQLPDTYKIQVIGYADASGPEFPEGNKPGNMAISKKRAQSVVDYIVKNYSIPADKFEVSGKGSSELKNTTNPKSAQNRRVVIQFQP